MPTTQSVDAGRRQA